jgi:hypothetical protein
MGAAELHARDLALLIEVTIAPSSVTLAVGVPSYTYPSMEYVGSGAVQGNTEIGRQSWFVDHRARRARRPAIKARGGRYQEYSTDEHAERRDASPRPMPRDSHHGLLAQPKGQGDPCRPSVGFAPSARRRYCTAINI